VVNWRLRKPNSSSQLKTDAECYLEEVGYIRLTQIWYL
jgi:hypothetical protein